MLQGQRSEKESERQKCFHWIQGCAFHSSRNPLQEWAWRALNRTNWYWPWWQSVPPWLRIIASDMAKESLVFSLGCPLLQLMSKKNDATSGNVKASLCLNNLCGFNQESQVVPASTWTSYVGLRKPLYFFLTLGAGGIPGKAANALFLLEPRILGEKIQPPRPNSLKPNRELPGNQGHHCGCAHTFRFKCIYIYIYIYTHTHTHT